MLSRRQSANLQQQSHSPHRNIQSTLTARAHLFSRSHSLQRGASSVCMVHPQGFNAALMLLGILSLPFQESFQEFSWAISASVGVGEWWHQQGITSVVETILHFHKTDFYDMHGTKQAHAGFFSKS